MLKSDADKELGKPGDWLGGVNGIQKQTTS